MSAVYEIWLRAGRPEFDPRQGQRIFPLSSVSRPALGPTQPPVQWVPDILSPGIKSGRGVMLTTHSHLLPRSWMSRSYTSSPPSASMACSGTALLYFYRDFASMESKKWCRPFPLISILQSHFSAFTVHCYMKQLFQARVRTSAYKRKYKLQFSLNFFACLFMASLCLIRQQMFS
jgi:hypothetical protein